METDCTTPTAAGLLGGDHVFNGNPPAMLLEWVPLVRAGFPVTCVTELAKHLDLPLTQISRTVGISPAMLANRKRDGLLRAEESERLLRFARIVERAAEVFESLEPALDWLNHPNRALGHVTPISLLDTEIGAEEVNRTLGRIAHGIFS